MKTLKQLREEYDANFLPAEYLSDEGIRYEVRFRPQPRDSVKKPADLQIKWHVFFNGECFDFSTGIGHLPKHLYVKYGMQSKYTQHHLFFQPQMALLVCKVMQEPVNHTCWIKQNN